MLKGVGRQVVVLKNTDSKIFEEAIFIIKDGAKFNKPDMITECERIIKNNYTGNLGYRQNTKKKKYMLYIGIATAVLLTGIVIFVISNL